MKSLNDWLNFFDTVSVDKPIMLGLDRIQQVATRMSLLPYPIPVITVAGTNGKGSTVALLESLLMAHDNEVASFTSPHLIHFNERFRHNAKPLGDVEIIEGFKAVYEAKGDIHLTYFEWITLSALYLFKSMPLDYLILEVGLGGRLDATNIVTPFVSLITSIGLDHMAILGETREEIGREKAGIMRRDGLCLCADSEPPQSVLQTAQALHVDFLAIGEDFQFADNGKDWHFISNNLALNFLPKPQFRLDNAALAIMCLAELPIDISRDKVIKALKQASLPGRCELVSTNPLELYDVAHNVDSITHLKNYLLSLKRKVKIVFCMAKDKDVLGAIAILKPCVESWYVGPFSGDRAVSNVVLAQMFKAHKIANVRYCDTIEEAYLQAKEDSEPCDLLVVTGSFLTVAQIKTMDKAESLACL